MCLFQFMDRYSCRSWFRTSHLPLKGFILLIYSRDRPYASGGLGLLPSSFSILIALMCLFQIWYQVSLPWYRRQET